MFFSTFENSNIFFTFSLFFPNIFPPVSCCFFINVPPIQQQQKYHIEAWQCRTSSEVRLPEEGEGVRPRPRPQIRRPLVLSVPWLTSIRYGEGPESETGPPEWLNPDPLLILVVRGILIKHRPQEIGITFVTNSKRCQKLYIWGNWMLKNGLFEFVPLLIPSLLWPMN